MGIKLIITKRLLACSVLLFLMSGLFFIYAQEMFIKDVYLQGYDLSIRHVNRSNDGGFFMSGSLYSSMDNQKSGLVIKTDSAHNILWSKKFSLDGNDEIIRCVDLPGRGIYFVGSTTSSALLNQDIFYGCMDSLGNFLWSHRLASFESDSAAGLISFMDMEILVYGTTYNASNDRELHLLKLDIMDNIMWTKTWGAQNEETGVDLVKTIDMGMAEAIYTNSFTIHGHQSAIVKYDFDGNSMWSKMYEGTEPNRPVGIVETEKGDLYMLGNVGQDIFILKTDLKGYLKWSVRYDTGDEDRAVDLISTKDSGLIVAGVTKGINKEKALFFKLNSQGQIAWSKLYFDSLEDVGVSELISINDTTFLCYGDVQGGEKQIRLLSFDNNAEISCSTESIVLNEQTQMLNEFDMMLMPLFFDSLSVAVPMLSDLSIITEDVCVVENSISAKNDKGENKMYYEGAFISFEIAEKKAHIFELFDLYGRIMLSKQIWSGERIRIDCANGVYFACLRDENAYVKKWKFMHAE
jgi:hypothetical protein